MLQNELFTFTGIIAEGDVVKANVIIDPTHPIFEGHFPGQPVLPGVCTTQMVKELLENYIQKKTRLVKALDIKFLAVIVPQADKLIRIELKTAATADNLIKAEASLSDEGITLFKFKGIFEVR
jgi:3-hydroxyacyl-[acyl-carrier-protein] dehydratase